ncbi:MAG TPA: hypothetical protein VFV99_01030 [Kofleriaceae bacterium]|nr:hypothetical protein [Kofleriaceae bacterium]
MTWLRLLCAVSLVGCVDNAGAPAGDDIDLAGIDTSAIGADKAQPSSWQAAATLHDGSHLFDFAREGTRHVHSMWVAGSNNNRVPLTIAAHTDIDHDVRIAVLGPLADDGTRAVLAADGYATRKQTVSVSVDVAQPGEHLVVVGSYNLASDTFYDLAAACVGPTCSVSRVDALATPKDGALVGDQDLVSMLLGDALVGYGDIEVELWASPPLQPGSAQLVGTSEASGSQINALVPTSVQAGDDLRLVVREAGGGRVLDTGVMTRFAPQPAAFARLDSIGYSDGTTVQIAGVVGFFEGVADMRMYSETHHREIAQQVLHVDRPGQIGNGLNGFDATFRPDAAVAAENGDLVSIGFINGNGDYRRLGCFEYCNPLSTISSCTGGPRACQL